MLVLDGVKFVTQLDSMKEKSEETQLERYGVTNISKTDKRRREIKEYSSGVYMLERWRE